MTDSKKNSHLIGQVLKERRAFQGWTLADLAEKTGISKSTLSKIENDLISPSYQSILQLCAGLGIEVGDLVSKSSGSQQESRPMTARRSISYGRSGLNMGDDNYDYAYLCTEIAHKRIVPMIIDVKVHSLHDIDGLWNHIGEEFLYVLEGKIILHTEFYEDTELAPGDSAYFDSTMGHAYIATGDTPARLLVVCSSAAPNLAQKLRDELAQRLVHRQQRGSKPNRDA